MNAVRTWQGDVVSLVEAFRNGGRSPVDEVRATLAAIQSSDLNAFSFVDAEGALERAEAADVALPLGGVPVGVKELHQVEGWPDTHASLLFADRTAPSDGTMVARLKAAGANLVGLTTASEFGGLNCSTTKLNGITRNPWRRDATPGGSSGGSAAAVTGGLVPIATGGDGGDLQSPATPEEWDLCFKYFTGELDLALDPRVILAARNVKPGTAEHNAVIASELRPCRK